MRYQWFGKPPEGGGTARGGDGSCRVRRLAGPVVALLLGGCLAAEAHRLDLSVHQEGRTIQGTASFHGGRPVVGATVEVRLASGLEVLATTVTDREGRFAVPVDRRAALEVVVYSQDGHAARVPLAAEALPPEAVGEGVAGGASAQEELARRVAQLVSEEVSRQLGPLREELAHLKRRIALRDVLGGLGYFLGLAGLGAYLVARRRPDGENSGRQGG